MVRVLGNVKNGKGRRWVVGAATTAAAVVLTLVELPPFRHYPYIYYINYIGSAGL